ncbi:DNA (cytosine-5-)-methyltransferase [Clostridium butyricum]|uniref:DNA (cytosine-5-)-methyltransferase n=1 Tax=Clostridium butyricum TaxID=1492 RepID=UPI00136B6EEE|nr:DNA (cytosine-5-)-methyltransferase [Clostridium butyricum]MBS5981398.1 DNA (cytosine-5-)-methyltransferase [Clostridium butyricum]MZI80321.1 DNA (cytosine-5-)-methyltransferase [Clostridium butyricum]
MKISKECLYKQMKNKGIKTQTELAQKMGITKNQLSVILSDKFCPVKSNVIKLCDTLEIRFEDIAELQKDYPIQLSFNNKVEETYKEDSEFIDISNVVAKNKYNVVELFAGAGGLALGLEEAGFNEVGLVEFDKHACNTLRKNRPEWNVIEDDVVKVSELGIRNFIDKDVEVDLLSGGYPCQAFSYAGNKAGLEDVRGTMFYYYAEILSQLKPKVFLAENVKGLVTHDNGKTLKIMIEVFENIGYSVKWKVHNAVDFGVAQKRERIVIIGIRDDLSNKVKFKFPKPFEYKPTLKDALKDVPISEGQQYSENKRKVLDLVPPGGCWVDLPEDIAKEFMGKSFYSGGGKRGMARRISWDEPCLTLTCSPAQKQTERCHPDETRPFTIREYARIQSFPDEWQFEGSIGQIYKQIGNAVPVNLAKAIGLSIINFLNQV